jgi:hypothetical protein
LLRRRCVSLSAPAKPEISASLRLSIISFGSWPQNLIFRPLAVFAVEYSSRFKVIRFCHWLLVPGIVKVVCILHADLYEKISTMFLILGTIY